MKPGEWIPVLVFVALCAAVVVALFTIPPGRSVELEEIDGVDCIVARNGYGSVRALSCDWGPQ